MVNIVVLQDTLNPISAQERVKINENWDALRRGFSSLQNQINFLSGGTEVDVIVARIEQAIQDAQTNTQNAIDNVNNNYAEKLVEIDQSLGDLATALTNTQTATAEANTARDNAILATNDAQTAIANVLAIVNDLRAVGEWNTTTNYKRNNLVSYDGQTYIALTDNINTPLTNATTWSLFAAKGVKGDRGEMGETGAALSIQGRLDDQSELPPTGEAGQAYTINGELWVWSENVMTWENVGNIKGEKGDTGDVGPQGPQGETPDLTPLENMLTDHENRITTLENEEVTVKADVSGLNREVAYLKLRQEAGERIEGGTVFADDFGGSRFGFELKAAKTESTVPLAQGETILTGKINAVRDGQFTVGSQITIADTNNSEMVTINRSETIETIENFTATNKTVVASAYSTAGNGGRKIVRLDSGTLIAANKSTVSTYNIMLYKSVDNGNTWTFVTNNNMFANNDFALISKGADCLVVFGYSTTSISVWNLTESGTFTPLGNIDTAQTAIGNISLTYDKSTNTLHAAWSSKNATYPNTFNIRYSKSTDGGVTWNAVEQVTPFNTAGAYLDTPTISIVNGEPLIICRVFLNSYYSIATNTYDGSWNMKYIGERMTYAQSNPSATVDKDGAIHLSWEGRDATNTSTNYVRYSKSADGGVTWDAMQKLVVGQNTSITTDKNGHIFITYENVGSTYYITSTDNGANWSSPTLIDAGTNPSSLDDSSLVYTVPPTVQMTDSNVVFNGNWTAQNEEYHLEVSPLTKAYTENAIIAESTINADGSFPTFLEDNIGDVINATVINDSNYSNGESNGKRLVKLDNGWYVAVLDNTSDSTNLFYVSKDKGVNWTLLTQSTASTGRFSLVSHGTMVYALANVTNTLRLVKFDATNVASNLGANYITVDNQVTSSDYNAIAIGEDGTTLHAIWSVRTGGYPNSSNLRYIKSTNGGDTWQPFLSLTKHNANDIQWLTPTMVVRNSVPYVFVRHQSGTSRYLMALSPTITSKFYNSNFVDDDWGSKIIHNTTDNFLNPSATVSNNGTLHVAWNSVTGTTQNVRYSNSTDGGQNWKNQVVNSISLIVQPGENPSIALDKNDTIFITYDRGGSSYFTSSTDVGATWTAEQLLGLGTNPSTIDDKSEVFIVPTSTFKTSSNISFTSQIVDTTVIETLKGVLQYSIPSTDYVGMFVKKQGNLTIDAYVNNVAMDAELVGNEYQFERSLDSKAPINLRLEAERTTVDGGIGDKITRILGGRS